MLNFLTADVEDTLFFNWKKKHFSLEVKSYDKYFKSYFISDNLMEH